MAKHPYDKACACSRCEHERARRAAQSAADGHGRPRRRSFRRRIASIASREEQNARYIDAGPQAWDDRD